MEAGAAVNWANAIPLVTLLVAVFSAGVVVAEVKAIRRDFKTLKDDLEKKIGETKNEIEKNISGVRENFIEDLHDLKKDFRESSEDQGRRIGKLEIRQEVSETRVELTGRHLSGIPTEVK